MLRWRLRALLALGLLILGTLAIVGGQTDSRRPEPPPPTPPAAGPSQRVSPFPTLAPTATQASSVDRVVSRVSRQTPMAYPTSTPVPPGVTLVSIVDFDYMPSITRIEVGQTVVWRNTGRELHDVTGEDDWYSGPIEGNDDYRHTFGFAGSFNYRCSVHPDMRGTVIVRP